MDKIAIYPGGQDFTRQDVNFLQDSVRKAFEGLSQVNGPNYIITGCLISPTGGLTDPVNCTEGFIVFDGEVMYVPQHEAASQFQDLVDPQFVVFEDVDAQHTNKDGSTYDVRLIRQARMVSVTVATSPMIAYNQLFSFQLDNWHYLGDPGEPTIQAINFSQDINGPLAFKRDGGRVRFKGSIVRSSNISSNVGKLFTLPDNDGPLRVRPFVEKVLPLTTDMGMLWCKIYPNGDVWQLGALNNMQQFYFDGISFDLDTV